MVGQIKKSSVTLSTRDFFLWPEMVYLKQESLFLMKRLFNKNIMYMFSPTLQFQVDQPRDIKQTLLFI